MKKHKTILLSSDLGPQTHADFLKLEHSKAAIDVNEHLGNLAKDDIRHER